MVAGAGFDPAGGGSEGGTKSCPQAMDSRAFARPRNKRSGIHFRGAQGFGGLSTAGELVEEDLLGLMETIRSANAYDL